MHFDDMPCMCIPRAIFTSTVADVLPVSMFMFMRLVETQFAWITSIPHRRRLPEVVMAYTMETGRAGVWLCNVLPATYLSKVRWNWLRFQCYDHIIDCSVYMEQEALKQPINDGHRVLGSCIPAKICINIIHSLCIAQLSMRGGLKCHVLPTKNGGSVVGSHSKGWFNAICHPGPHSCNYLFMLL